MASAVPLYQCSSMRCWGGRTSMNSSHSRLRKPQASLMCRCKLRALYCVSTSMRRRPLLRQLESVKSTIRYCPPNGTAGLARSRVRGSSRVPLPPARTKVKTSLTVSVSCPFSQHKSNHYFGKWNRFGKKSESESEARRVGRVFEAHHVAGVSKVGLEDSAHPTVKSATCKVSSMLGRGSQPRIAPGRGDDRL